MTGRDRLVVMGLIVLAVLAGGWLLLVAPERQQAVKLETQVATAQQQLQSAQTQAATARSAQTRYVEAYASIVRLGKAVPPLDEVPSLIYELDRASNQRDVDFNSISAGAGGGSSGASASSAAAAAGTPAGFSQMPFTFVFKGSFFGLAHLLSQIDGFAKVLPGSHSAAGQTATTALASNGLQVNGRLLTIQGVDLTLEGGGGSGAGKTTSGSASGPNSGEEKPAELTATITATAYVLPASEGLTGGANATGPAGTSATSSPASASSPTTPAVIQAAP